MRSYRICLVWCHCFHCFTNWVITHLFSLAVYLHKMASNFVCCQKCPVSSPPTCSAVSMCSLTNRLRPPFRINLRPSASTSCVFCWHCHQVSSSRSREHHHTSTYFCLPFDLQSLNPVCLFVSLRALVRLMHSCCLPMLSFQCRLFSHVAPCHLLPHCAPHSPNIVIVRVASWLLLFVVSTKWTFWYTENVLFHMHFSIRFCQ